MQADTPDHDVRSTLVAIEFRIGSKLEDTAQLNQSSVEL